MTNELRTFLDDENTPENTCTILIENGNPTALFNRAKSAAFALDRLKSILGSRFIESLTESLSSTELTLSLFDEPIHCADFSFSFNPKNPQHPIFPDPYFLMESDLQPSLYLERLHRAETGHYANTSHAYWRGSTTGYIEKPLDADTCFLNERIRLCAESRAYDELDMRITDVVQASPALKPFLESIGILAPRVHFSNFADYQFLLEIDGNVGSWGFFKKLSLGSCVLRIHPRNKQWIDDYMFPGSHYILLPPSCSEIYSTIALLKKEPNLAKCLASSCVSLAWSLSKANVAKRFASRLLDLNLATSR